MRQGGSGPISEVSLRTRREAGPARGCDSRIRFPGGADPARDETWHTNGRGRRMLSEILIRHSQDDG